MTRMWCIPPEILCDDHLRGEHAEHHQLVGTIRNHPHGETIAAGHAEKGNIDTNRVENRHAELIAEMERRGFDHDSSLEYGGPDFGVGVIDRGHNLSDLLERCSENTDSENSRADAVFIANSVSITCRCKNIQY